MTLAFVVKMDLIAENSWTSPSVKELTELVVHRGFVKVEQKNMEKVWKTEQRQA